jgi:hypothetical protein
MRSLGPDWHHGKLVSVLWRAWFAASIQPILLRMGPQSLKIQPTLFWLVTLRFARCSVPFGPRSDVYCLFHWNVAVVDKMAEHCRTGTHRVAAITQTSQHFVPYPRKRTPRKITKRHRTNRSFHTLRYPQKNSTNTRNWNHDPRTADLPANRDNLPDNFVIVRLRNLSLLIVAITGAWNPIYNNIFYGIANPPISGAWSPFYIYIFYGIIYGNS